MAAAAPIPEVSSLFQQWARQQQQQHQKHEDEDPGQIFRPHTSYRLLFQYTSSLYSRVQSAHPTENPQVFRRVGLPTPEEVSSRQAFAGSAWLEYMVDTARTMKRCHVIWIPTSPLLDANHNRVASGVRTSSTLEMPPLPAMVATEQSPDMSLTVIDPTALSPWGWDDDDVDDTPAGADWGGPSLDNLKGLRRAILEVVAVKRKIDTPVFLIWESLTALFVHHGFERVLSFVSTAFQTCFQVWPVRTGTLTQSQHARLEETADALLHLHRGSMTMIRRGVRETGNIVRGSLPFHVDSVGRVSEAELSHKGTTSGHNTYHHNALPTEDPDTEPKPQLYPPFSKPQQEESSGNNTTTYMYQKKIQLSFEADDRQKPEHRPQIYLQDDDPEFADMDEEDPDDDLVI